MDKEKRKHIGAVLGAVGLLVLTLNLVDYFAGWNRIAHETTIVGIALALGGAYFALTGGKQENKG
jgi:hypothetical protein